jgi:hypothetical protein
MIIGLSGKAQSGKDTVYKMIVYAMHYWRYYNKMKEAGYVEFKEEYSLKHMEDCYGYYVKDFHIGIYKHSFAKYLKEALAAVCNCDASDFESIVFKNSKVPWLDLTYRELLQKFGTAIRNEVCDDFWVKAAFKDITKDSYHHIFTDVRFISEAEAVKKHGGVLVRINRDGAGAGNHVSETELDNYDFDVVINNNGNLEDLLEQVRVLLTNLNLI